MDSFWFGRSMPLSTRESESIGSLTLLKRLWGHLNRRRRRQFAVVLVLMLVSALVEVISLGALLPFLGALSSPERVLTHPMVRAITAPLGITSVDQILLPLTVMFALASVSATGIRLLLLWASIRLSFATGADLGIEVYRRTLYQPYYVHIVRNSSDVISGITNKVAGLVYGGLLPVVSLASSMILFVAIMFALLAIDTEVAAYAALSVGTSYALIIRWSRRRLEENSQQIAREQPLVLKSLQEGLGGIRDVLLDNTQEFYCRVYTDADRPLRRAQGSNQLLASAPRFVIEAVAMVSIATIAYVLTQGPNGLALALPLLGALALGAQRLLQAVQMAYTAWAGMAGSRASLADALALLDQPLPVVNSGVAIEPIFFREGIRFRNVDFRYTSDGPWILENFDLTIPRGSRLGIVGTTGSGKSTSLDLLMGLLTPEHGEILVDDIRLTLQNLVAWQRLIAHVPQHIYLADSSIAENIAFGIPRESIDFVRVRSAARQAHIAELIENSSAGFDTRVGERGIRLSGGQRQRIGIARALYKDAKVLVFDEATSALDSVTEAAVMEAITELNRDMTIILVAHRITTVKQCDTIIELDRGRIVASGTFDDLLEKSSSFRKLTANLP